MRTIYQLGIVAALLFTTLAGSAQSRSYRIYDQYANREGITFLAFSKSMIDAVNMNIDEENKKVTGDLMEIRILFSNREKNKNHGSLAQSISDKLNNLDYRKIQPNDAKDDDNVEFWIDGNSKRVKECHVLVKNSEDHQFSCLVSFYGNFKVEDLKSFEKFSKNQADKED